MKRIVISVFAVVVLAAWPAFALVTSTPLPAQGITPDEMAQLLGQHQMLPKPMQGSDGQPYINGQAVGVGFDVSFGKCSSSGCQDVYFKAGWSKAGPPIVTLEKLNDWNNKNHFLHVYVSPDKTLWAEMDARVAYGTTANAEAYIELWRTQLRAFKSFMQW